MYREDRIVRRRIHGDTLGNLWFIQRCFSLVWALFVMIIFDCFQNYLKSGCHAAYGQSFRYAVISFLTNVFVLLVEISFTKGALITLLFCSIIGALFV